MIERLQDNPALSGALSAITASVVGVIANLAVWFALQILFHQRARISTGFISVDAPVLSSVDVWAVLLSVVAGFALLYFKLGVTRTLGICSAASLLLHLVLGVV